MERQLPASRTVSPKNAAVSAAVTAFLFVKDKQKKDDEELMEYLDSSIE